MFKIETPENTNKTYIESPQPNPMQWRWMHRTKDTLTAQAGWMKCRDFFNDLVALKHGIKMNIYGLETGGMKFNKYGLYVELKNVLADTLITNIETAINPRMQQDLGVEIRYWKQDDERIVILLPMVVFKSTYLTSLTTMLIRLSNYATLFESFEDFYISPSPMGTIEKAFSPRAQQLTKHFGFKPPKEDWYYAPYGYTSSSNHTPNFGTLHNNGVSDWAHALANEGLTY